MKIEKDRKKWKRLPGGIFYGVSKKVISGM
jgi:hypothetical protein